MGLREELEKRIDRKLAEIREFEDRLREARAYLQGLQDTLKLVPRETLGDNDEVVLRNGSNIAKAREVLRLTGKPMHIIDLLKAMNQPTDKKNRLALGGSLAAYVRRSLVFNRPAPNTFGLLEFDQKRLELSFAVPVPAVGQGNRS
jgi:hypothetical protein